MTRKQTTRPHRQHGFTLMELLIVIVIIAALAALAFPISMKMRKSAKTAVCISNVKQIGAALIEYTVDNNNKLPGLQPLDPATGKRGNIWTMGLAHAGYLWDTPGKGTPPCGKGVWTCPSCDFMSNAYGGFGVAEGSIFQYDDQTNEAGTMGSLRLNQIDDPANTWLVGDAAQKPSTPNKGWYAITANPSGWTNGHCPAGRHDGKSNVCMVDGHVESLTTAEIKKRQLTNNVIRR